MIRIPKIKGIIDRRILINYRIKIDLLKAVLPEPFEPIEINGFGIAGICLIRLKQIRPVGLPGFLGIGSENGAHRIAVKWLENGEYKEGVYIPRRDTDSWMNMLAGGRVFPGEHFLSDFKTNERDGRYKIAFAHKDGTSLEIIATETDGFPEDSLFKSLDAVSRFFEEGAVGYSPNQKQCFDCVELKTYNWKVSSLKVERVVSSFFNDEKIFPKESVIFDNALLMKDIDHEWNLKASMNF